MSQVKAVNVPLTKQELEELIRYAVVNEDARLEARLREGLRKMIRSDLEDLNRKQNATSTPKSTTAA